MQAIGGGRLRSVRSNGTPIFRTQSLPTNYLFFNNNLFIQQQFLLQ
jgi:hypothetical protein